MKKLWKACGIALDVILCGYVITMLFSRNSEVSDILIALEIVALRIFAHFSSRWLKKRDKSLQKKEDNSQGDCTWDGTPHLQ